MSHDKENRQLAAELLGELRNFTGDPERYRHGINRRVIYTPGVRHLAERAKAYWLIDAIAGWIGAPAFNAAARRDPRIADMHFWRLDVDLDAGSAVLTARADSGEDPFISQKIPFTDFPLAAIEIWAAYDGTHWTLYLPSEH